MNKKCVFILALLLFLFCLHCPSFQRSGVRGHNGFSVHNLMTGLNYTTIQDAIDANETLDGHAIFVEEGTYYENIVVSKSLVLFGESRDSTIIDGEKKGITVNITADEVFLTRFAIKNSGLYFPNSSICLYRTNFTSVTDNIIEQGNYGILLLSSNNITINANQIADNSAHGIVLNKSHNNTIKENNLTRNGSEAINLYQSNRNWVSENNIFNNVAAVWMDESSYNVFSGNDIQNATASYMHVVALANSEGNSFIDNDINNFNRTRIGIVLYSCNDTIIVGNNIENCDYGLYLSRSNRNRIYHNNVLNTTHQAYIFETSTDNDWDDGFKGNYWSDYVTKYPYAAQTDDTWGTPYVIDAENIDNHPLVSQFVIPEFPSFLILPLFFTATLLTAIICRSKRR